MLNEKILKDKLCEFEELIGYNFTNKENLMLALTHSSYANEYKNHNLKSNERLEFLGDAVLNIIVSELIYLNYPDLTEGEMSKLRASVVCEPALMECSNTIRTGDFLLLGKGEDLTGGRKRPSILSDAFEAIIGAIYIDGGFDEAKKFALKHISVLIDKSMKGLMSGDYKTMLQEIVQKKGEVKIIYEIIDEKGPDHDKLFVSQVIISGVPAGIGKGKSKKEAEQNAAKVALAKIRGQV